MRQLSGTGKFDHGLMQLRHSELHWLDVPERIQYKLGVTSRQCLQSRAPQYLVDCCTPTLNVTSSQHICSASQHQMTELAVTMSWNDKLVLPAYHSMTSSQQVRSSGILRYQPDDWELSA